ncbi:putative late blight resistance protein homolog R1A-3 [Solanum pennellii]|uniref:Late blight resistance protein homolog R1A-3 n=1 Tax=Solanum pennellii TaxID=28526 RepID=A0ABM1UZC2_SOLPN|nr:putative late blight resistance protein homolog R1A-3 [Solanum pennellii]
MSRVTSVVIVVAGLVGKMDPTYDNRKRVEENLNSFFEDREIGVPKLIRLWIAEEFLRGRSNKSLQVVGEEYLQELIDRSLMLAGGHNGMMRSCKIHDLLCQLCLREAHTENVVHVMNGNDLEAIDDQRRVILLSEVAEKHDYCMQRSSGIIRTFISMQVDFPIRMCSIVSVQFKLLKLLDALPLLYDFSSVISDLIHLRYVAARIKKGLLLAKLRNIQTIILQSLEKTELKHPVDIWTISEVRHVDIRLPLYISNPLEAENNRIGEHLDNLQTLTLHFSPFAAEIIRRTPNLKEVTILHEAKHSDGLAILDSLSLVEKLEKLHLEAQQTVNQIMIFSGDIFLPNLKELTLSFTYIPWEAMSLLANLPNLEVLKGYFAFNGTDWSVFRKLKLLLLHRCIDLQKWEGGSDNFLMLEKLMLFGLDELEEIPESIGDIMSLKFIQIFYCSNDML